MAIIGECPKCGNRILHVNVENILGMIDGDSKAHCLSFSCIHCNVVLAVQMDPRSRTRPKRTKAASASG